MVWRKRYLFNSINGDILNGAIVVYNGDLAQCQVTELTPGTEYFFAVYTFNGSDGLENYLAAPATANETTNATATQLAFINSPAAITSGESFNLTVQAQDALGNPAFPLAPVTVTIAVTNGTGTLFGTLTGVINTNANSVSFEGLNYQVSGQAQVTITASSENDVLTADDVTLNINAASPSTQDRLLLFSSVTATSMTVRWTRGNGENRILVAKPGSAVDFTPVNGQAYPLNYTSGTNAVKYYGNAATANVTGLTPGTDYHFRLFSYNGTGASTAYNTEAASFNPRNRATAASKESVAAPDETSEEDMYFNNFYVSGINPNPVVNQINFRMSTDETMTATISVIDASGREVAVLANNKQISKGDHNFNFNLSNELASGTYLLVISSGDQTAVQSFVIVK